jgi:hypothetical protein
MKRNRFVGAMLLAAPLLLGSPNLRADNVFHIGHSLMEKEMPLFVQKFADHSKIAHSYHYQLIIGSPLQYHWNTGNLSEEEQVAKGRQGKSARASIATGKYDAVIMCDATPCWSI